VRSRVANESKADAGLTVQTTLMDRAGQTVGSAESPLKLTAASETETSQEIAVANPALWSARRFCTA
jgi:beta-galactosidase/beta-glucuronidase